MKVNSTSDEVLKTLHSLGSEKKAKDSARFFKTGVGEYGYGDKFWGLTVPQVRQVVKEYRNLRLSEVEKLLQEEIHEVRLCALLLLVKRFFQDPENVYHLYMRNLARVNNWDLVDLSAPQIVGRYLEKRPKKILETMAHSKNLWKKRIAVLASFYFISQGKSKESLKIAEILVNDQEDLIQKAVGWMLREIGKRCSVAEEEKFLDAHAATMPRTALRYALEHFPPKKKKYYMERVLDLLV